MYLCKQVNTRTQPHKRPLCYVVGRAASSKAPIDSSRCRCRVVLVVVVVVIIRATSLVPVLAGNGCTLVTVVVVVYARAQLARYYCARKATRSTWLVSVARVPVRRRRRRRLVDSQRTHIATMRRRRRSGQAGRRAGDARQRNLLDNNYCRRAPANLNESPPVLYFGVNVDAVAATSSAEWRVARCASQRHNALALPQQRHANTHNNLSHTRRVTSAQLARRDSAGCCVARQRSSATSFSGLHQQQQQQQQSMAKQKLSRAKSISSVRQRRARVR